MEVPPRNPQNSKATNYTGARHHRAPSEVLCPCLNGSEPSLIQSEAAVDKTCYSLSHGCSIKMRSWEFGDQFDALSSMSCSLSHSWAVLQCDRLRCPALGPLPSGRAIDTRGYTSSATLFGCVVGVKEYLHECQYTRFPSRTLHRKEMMLLTSPVICFNIMADYYINSMVSKYLQTVGLVLTFFHFYFEGKKTKQNKKTEEVICVWRICHFCMATLVALGWMVQMNVTGKIPKYFCCWSTSFFKKDISAWRRVHKELMFSCFFNLLKGPVIRIRNLQHHHWMPLNPTH